MIKYGKEDRRYSQKSEQEVSMYKEKQLVGIAKRENNTKRKYLVVNRLQGKHIPVRPKEAFQMFSELAAQVREIGRASCRERVSSPV